ncbi:MAG TPA: hypothetical protein V6C76_08135 [Drouetiella sp.]
MSIRSTALISAFILMAGLASNASAATNASSTSSAVSQSGSMSLVEEGKANFRLKRYYAAEDCFNRAAAADPSNQLIRYLIGQTLEQLYDSKAAKVAYMDCYRINPFNNYGEAAKKALTDLNSRMEAQAHQPADTIEQTQQTIDMIHRQSNQMQRINIRYGQAQANWATDIGNRAAARYGDYNRYNYRDVRNGRTLYNYDDEYSTRGQIRSSWARSDAAVQALNHQAMATQKAREIANSAANLESLLAEKKVDGEAKLRALGTNLFVRYYGNSDHEDPLPSDDPPIELRATEQKLQDLPATKPSLKAKSANTEVSSTNGHVKL